MIIIHAVQKLLNTSRLEAALYITKPDTNQYLHCWYARLLASSFPGKMMVMYVHEPSLMAVICKGKTIQGTWETFKSRLKLLLRRHKFSEKFIYDELAQAEGYTVSKTNSKSILAFMNQMVFELEYQCRVVNEYDAIPLDELEDRFMDRLHQTGKKQMDYSTPLKYWRKEIGMEK